MAAEWVGVLGPFPCRPLCGPRLSSSRFHDNKVAVEGRHTLAWELRERKGAPEGAFGQRILQKSHSGTEKAPGLAGQTLGDLPEDSAAVRPLAGGPCFVSGQLFLEGRPAKGASSGKRRFWDERWECAHVLTRTRVTVTALKTAWRGGGGG